MKKLILNLTLTFTVILSSIALSNLIKFPTRIHLEGNYMNLKANMKEIINDSGLIVIGKPIKINTFEYGNIIFTDYEIQTQEVLKNSNNHNTEKIVVRLTGGKLNGVEQVSENIKQLDLNNTYLFALHRTFPEKVGDCVYTPMGAYQGILNVNSKDSESYYTVNGFNKDNEIEKEVLNKKLNKNLHNNQ
ncbi:hypothetical protein [Desnuesiella massiliensis]|uniref:hypothetical protein n=1 Tax=Desnuesiella massiliensis TaxID=1650662 RepID=UPI0006E1F418|nr:hypothetical protein [Desnuesiella massiliensis]